MYFIKNGKKEKYNPKNSGSYPITGENFVQTRVKEEYDKGKKCPTWVFISLGILASFIALWLIFSIIKDKK